MSEIKIERDPSAERLRELGVDGWPTWTKEVSSFPWSYGSAETCYIGEGEVVVTPDGQVLRAEVISFEEPPDYLPRDAWLRQFDGRGLDAELAMRKAIRPMTGATLTARAITDAVRRTLALHAMIFPGDIARAEAPR